MTPAWTPTDELLTRFLRGECTSEESLSVQGWLSQSADHARRLEGLRLLLAPAGAGEWNVDRLWATVRSKTVDANRQDVSRSHRRRRTPQLAFSKRSWRTPLAASLLIALLGTATWLERRPRAPSPADAAPDVVYQTRRGQTATVQLSDGSRVRLAPQTRLVIAASFGDSIRDLTLEGEAAFEVRHDAAHPFRVRTATSVTEDIGTRFGIRAYRDESSVTVAVADGAVTVAHRLRSPTSRSGPEGVLLHAGELGVIAPGGNVATTRGAATERALAWTTDQLIFDKRPLSTVLTTLSRWYDLDIHAADSVVASHLVTAHFSTQSVDEMLQALAIATEAVVERQGRRVTLRAGR